MAEGIPFGMPPVPGTSGHVTVCNGAFGVADGGTALSAINSAITALQSAVTAAQAVLTALGSASTHPASDFDASGAASAAQSASLQKTANLDDLGSIPAAQANLGLGTAAFESASAFDGSGAADAVQTNLNTHAAATGTAVHGLGTASTHADTDFATPSYVTTALGSYLPLIGGTLSGPIRVSTVPGFGNTAYLVLDDVNNDDHKSWSIDWTVFSGSLTVARVAGIYPLSGQIGLSFQVFKGSGLSERLQILNDLLTVTGRFLLGSYTTGTLPTEVDGALIYVTDLPGIMAGVSGSWVPLT